MKNLFKYIGIFSLFVFSLIYTNKIADIMKSKSNIMKSIKEESTKNKIEAVDAIIEGNYIIPGINGLVIDENKSYSNMVSSGTYDKDLLIFKEIIPSISLTNNLDKIIKKANKLKRAVAIIVDDQNTLNHLIKENIRVNYLVDNLNIIKSDKAELINNEINNFYKIEKFLNKYNYNHNICVLNKYNEDICRKNNKYLIIPTYTLNNSNIVDYISEIDSGDIIKIDNMSIDNLNVLIDKIRFRDLNFLYLSELISENNTSL